MKKMNFNQMEMINGGTTEAGYEGFNLTEVDGRLSNAQWGCLVSLGMAVIGGTGGLITAAGSGGLAIGFSIAMMWGSFAGAAISCKDVSF